MNEFIKNVVDSMVILEIMSGVNCLGKAVVNDLKNPNSFIIPYTTLLLSLASTMTVNKCIKDHFCKNILEEEEEDFALLVNRKFSLWLLSISFLVLRLNKLRSYKLHKCSKDLLDVSFVKLLKGE